jgi:Double-GTPase 2
MDDLIGGLFALAIGAIVVSFLIAVAIAVFLAGAAGGAVIGLGQGSLAFASDLGGSVTSRGRARRSPLPPEPAFQLYILGQLKDDLGAALQHAWKEMLSFRDACTRFADQYNKGWTTPLAWGVVAGGYIAPFIGAGLGLIVAAPILLIAGLLIAGAWILVGVLRFAEAIRRKVRRTAYECPHDHERFPLPVYVCPSCGAEHRDLVPGRWGVFRRECQCEGVSLPTTVLGGRQRVPQRCPNGHPMSGLIGFAETLRIALVAGPSAGKTTYLAAAMLEFEEIAAEKRLAVDVLEESSTAYGKVVGGLRQGHLPEKTQISGNPALVTEVQGKDRSRVLYAYDVAGENYQGSDAVRNLRFLDVPSGLILLVDPLSIKRVADEHATELSESRDAVMPSGEEPIRVLERTVAALIEAGADPKDIPVAVVISKVDVFGIGEEIERLRADAGDEAPKGWLDANGAGNFVRSVEGEFKQVSWFSCSALGRIPDAGDRSAFKPQGATAPLLWLLARRGVVPAARPFEPAHKAEELKGADASTFPPISGGGWAWRVAFSSLAVLLFLGVISFGIAQVAGSSDSSAVASGASHEEREEEEFEDLEREYEEETYEPEPEPSAVDSRGFPPGGQAVIEQEIQTVLREYHQAVVNGQFDRAWRMLSRRKQDQALEEDGYSQWKEAQASLSPYLEPSGVKAVFLGQEEHGVARVDVSGMDWYAPGSSCSEWSGLTWAKFERGAWYYDPGYSTTGARERDWKPRYSELLGATC